MCPPPFLITDSRRQRHALILLSMKRCESFCHSVTIARFSFFHRLELTLVADSLLKSCKITPNSVIHGINIRAIWRPHVKFNGVDALCFQIVHRGPGGVHWRSILLQCSPDDILLWCQAADSSRGDICSRLVWAVNFRSRIDEDSHSRTSF